MSAPGTGIVILAAGESSRMGRPKQLLPWHGKPLLRHVAEAALSIGPALVCAVLGANAAEVRPSLDGTPVITADNAAWSDGMASSLRCGLETVTRLRPDLDGVIFLVCDQPHVTEELLTAMLRAAQGEGRTVVACEYDGATGVPAWFHRCHFPELLALHGAQGARQVMRAHEATLARVPFADGSADLDTPDDYDHARLLVRQLTPS